MYSAIAPGGTVCGTVAWDGTIRDTDWYEFSLPTPCYLTWTVTAEFMPDIVIADHLCPTTVLASNFGPACTPVSVSKFLAPGTYTVMVAPSFSNPVISCAAAEKDYTASLSCGGDAGCTVPGECCGGHPNFTDPDYSGFGSLVSVGTASPQALGNSVVTVFDLAHGNNLLNTDFAAPMYSHPSWSDTNLGSVFGITLDPLGNIYVASTTCYSLDTLGTLAGGSAGAIFKLDATSGVASLFATLPNTGPALGNICYDCEHDQFFVSNMDDGKIYRLDTSGAVLSTFDFGAPDNPSNVFPPLGDRVWAVQKHNGQLFFSVWWEDAGHKSPTQANEIWSIALDGSGDFSGAPQLQISMPPLASQIYSNPVSDIRFTPKGTLLAAERGMRDETTPTPHQARLLEFVCVNGVWTPSTNTFEVGGYSNHTNCAGGVDVGGRVYVTGDALQLSPQHIYGHQGLPSIGGTAADSILVDYNGTLNVNDKTFIGDIAVPCERCGLNPLVSCNFDDGANFGLDSSGNGHWGALGWATVVSGPCGNALHFLPNNNVDEFTIPDASDLNLLGGMTGMALIRPLGQQSTDNNPSCTEGTIFSKGGNYWFQVEKFNNKLVFQNEGSGTDLATANIGLCLNEWTHVAFVRGDDGKTIRFYKNGLPIGSPTTLVNAATANNDPLMVGNHGFGNDPGACEFNGDIDEIRIYDRALTDSEVLHEFQCGCPIESCTPGTVYPHCFGDGTLVACPCANTGSPGHGCENSAGTGGAILAESGLPSLAADTVVFTSSGELPSVTSVLLQGTATVAPAIYGDGRRCTGGSLKRLFTHSAVGGTVTMPHGADLSVSARSAALGAPILPGSTRLYQVFYRDPSPSFCPSPTGSTFNISSGIGMVWAQ